MILRNSEKLQSNLGYCGDKHWNFFFLEKLFRANQMFASNLRFISCFLYSDQVVAAIAKAK